MATITKGKTFVNGELVTPEKLHQMVDAATLSPLVNADIASNAAIADTKLATISTANKVAQSAVTNLATDLAGKAASSHTHDDRYYTETEMNTLLAGKQASGSYAASSHTHAATDITSGTLEIARIPTGATATTVCIGNDSRLSDARTPTAHNHDDRYYTETEMNTLLAGKQASGSYAASSHTHSAADITTGTLANARTTATDLNNAWSIVARDGSKNFNAGIITLNGFSQRHPTSFVELSDLSVITSGTGSAGKLTLQQTNGTFQDVSYVDFIYNGLNIGRITRNTSSSVAFVNTSDYRLKTNIEPLTAAVARLLQIPVCRFNWLADPTAPKVDGFLAHEAQTVVPEAVTGTKDAVDADGKPVYQGIDQSKLVPLLVAAVQELAARVAALEAK